MALLSRTRCPRCAHLGKDNAKDNLAVYSDGHSHCFSCGYHDRGPLVSQLRSSLTRLSMDKSHRGNSYLHAPSRNDDHPMATFNIPRPALDWLSSYGISEAEIHEHNIWYDLEKDLLVFPIYNGQALVCTNSRYFGSNPRHPKYITWGVKDHFKLFPQKESSVYVLVEDFVSAIKVGRQFNTIPLLGSNIPNKLILSLIPSKPILRIWLDFNKNESAILATNKARQYIEDCGTIVSTKDPKEYSNEEIRAYIEPTLSDPEIFSRIYSLPEV